MAMSNTLNELEELIVFEVAADPPKVDYKWNENNTKLLIELYGKYKEKVGTLEIRTSKMLWARIATELQQLGITISSSNCHNRWRVVERNYKKFVDNNNKTGRGRKFYEYEKEMEEIFMGKKNIHPIILLGAETIHEIRDEEEEAEEAPQQQTADEQVPAQARPTKPRPKTRVSTLERMRQDRKIYYDGRLEREDKRTKILERKVAAMEQRNVIQERIVAIEERRFALEEKRLSEETGS